MPELPEVETIRGELEKAVVAQKITGVVINNPKVIRHLSKQQFVRELTGKTIQKVLRKGKLLIMELSSGKSLAIHLKMTGQLVYPGNATASRVSFSLSGGKTLDFNDRRLFGELTIVDNWQELAFVRGLGPEPFDLSGPQFAQMLSTKKTKIKPLLLDQTFISGIGNLYAAEALFRARIHPATPAVDLTDRQKQVLLKEIKATLSEAIRCGGSSVDQYVQLNGRQGGYVKHHKVYDRQGKPCLSCKTPIKRIAMGGRGTYFCPRCQSQP